MHMHTVEYDAIGMKRDEEGSGQYKKGVIGIALALFLVGLVATMMHNNAGQSHGNVAGSMLVAKTNTAKGATDNEKTFDLKKALALGGNVRVRGAYEEVARGRCSGNYGGSTGFAFAFVDLNLPNPGTTGVCGEWTEGVGLVSIWVLFSNGISHRAGGSPAHGERDFCVAMTKSTNECIEGLEIVANAHRVWSIKFWTSTGRGMGFFGAGAGTIHKIQATNKGCLKGMRGRVGENNHITQLSACFD